MQYRRVVIGVDFSEASLAAARWVARRFAPDAEIVLVHALPTPDVPSYLRPHVPSPVERSAAVAPVFYGGLCGLAGLIGAGRAHVYMTVGQPADVLARAAEQLDADLVCVGRGARRRGSARFGSTTGVRLLARTRVPTLLVPTGTRGTPAHVAAAIDDRPGSERIVATACRLASAFEARVDLVHVVDDELARLLQTADAITATADEDGGAGLGDKRSAWSHRVQALAHEWAEQLLDQSVAFATRGTAVVRTGDPGQAVVAHSVEYPVDLVVIGRGGDAPHAVVPPGVRPVGSTTRLVTWAAPCPVLVLALDPAPATVGDDAAPLALRSRARQSPSARLRPDVRPPGNVARGDLA